MKEEQALSIAGSDSGGGAGIQADLKTFSALGVFGTTVITSITSQNTKGVQNTFALPKNHVRDQIKSIFSDFDIDAIKTGMLHSKPIIETIATEIKDKEIPIVIDPVMVAESGDPLLNKESITSFKKKLLPTAEIITPNRYEAETLTEKKIETKEEIKEACKTLNSYGASNVLITGGHLNGNDYFYDGEDIKEIKGKKIEIKSHGSGCTHSSAIAAYLAKRENLFESVKKAKDFTTDAIKSSHRVGNGNRPVNQLNQALSKKERYKVLLNLNKSISKLKKGFKGFIPEVGSNIGMAISSPEKKEDIAAIPGRIISLKEEFEVVGCPWFGASDHIARIILKANEEDEEIRAAANVKFTEELLRDVKELGYSVSSFDRKNVSKKDTMTSGTKKAIEKNNGIVPDIIYDRGGVGKEPMIRFLGETATEVVEKINKLI